MSDIWRIFWFGMIVMAIIAAAMAVMTSPAPAKQRQFCDTERAMLDMLQRNYSEWPAWHGEAGPNRLILTRNSDGGWTLLTVSGGRACISAAGSRSRFDNGV